MTSSNQHFFHFSIPLNNQQLFILHFQLQVHCTDQNHPKNVDINEDIKNVIGVTLACVDFYIDEGRLQKWK